MRASRPVLIAASLTWLAVSPALAGRKVVIDAAPGFEPASYRTYVLSLPRAEGTAPPEADPQAAMQKAVTEAVEAELRRIGWVPAAEGETPDLRVAFGAAGEPTSKGSRAVWVYDFWDASISIYGRQTQYVGWFTIGILDGATHDPLWQGYHKVALEPDEVKARRTLEKTVRKLLGRLP